MAVIDAALVYINNKAAAATVTSDVIDLGKNGAQLRPLYICVKLTEGLTGGSMTEIEVQSSTDTAFSTPIKEKVIAIKKTADEQKHGGTLAYDLCSIEPFARYARVIVRGSSPAGGKLWAYISSDVQLPVM